MNRFHHPSEHEIQTSQREILASLEASGLDRATTLILGGSALAFAGIRPTHDVDAMVVGSAYQEMSHTPRTPGGLRLQPKARAYRPFLETTHDPRRTNVMPFDITHPHDDHDHKPSPELDKMFLSRIIQFPEMQGFRYMPPELVAAMKADIGRRKDRRDLKLINQHLH